MSKRTRMLSMFLFGALWGALAAWTGGCLVRNLSRIVSFIGAKAGAEAALFSQITQVLSQLQQSNILSPWLWTAGGGALLGLFFARICPRRVWPACLAAVLLFVPAAALALWYTQVNDIRVGALVRCVLPLARSLF